ncbi:MAG TPA: cupin domain-containing protein [Opitutaceae bacterium]
MYPLHRFLLVALLSTLAMAASAEPILVTYSPPTNTEPLGSTVVDWATLPFRPTPIGRYCPVFDQPTPTLGKLEVHITMLLPGRESHPPHSHPWEEMLLIKEGRVEASLNGSKVPAGPGALIFLASRDAHNLTNVGATPATYYVINFCTDPSHATHLQPAADWAPPGLLRSGVIDCDHLPATPTKIGLHCSVCDSPTITFARLESHITTLNPGETTTPRGRDPGDELFIVKSGLVEATLGGVVHKVSAGSLFYVAPNDERTLRNIGPGPCSYQVIKVVSDRSPAKA